MPKVQPGAKTQAAARKVADSDKPIAQVMAEDDAKHATVADEARQRLVESFARLREADSKTTARQRLEKAGRTALKESMTKKPAPAANKSTLTPLDEDDDHMVLVYYGPAGTRKTTSTLRVTKTQETGRVLVIAAESGLKRQALQRNGVDTSRVVFWPPRGEAVSYEGLEALFYQILADLERDPVSWLAVSWDSLTEIIQTLVDQATQADIARLQEIAKAANKSFEIRKSYEREGGDYQVATQQFRQLLRKWRSLPCHQIFVCLEEDRKETIETDEGRKQKIGIIGPSLTPKVREDLEQHADIIMRTTVVDVPGVGPVGFGRATPAEDLRAKDRYGLLPVLVVDPGFERVWAYVTGEMKADQDQAQEVAAAVGPVLESTREVTERKKEEAEARKATRQTAAQRRAASPKGQAPKPSEKVTAESGTPDNPPM